MPLELSSTVWPGRSRPVSSRCRTAATAETTCIVTNLRQTSPSASRTRSGVPMAWLMWSCTHVLLRCRVRCPGVGRALWRTLCRVLPDSERSGRGNACAAQADTTAVQLLSQVRASGVEQQAGDVPAVRHLHIDGADVVTDLLQRRQLGLGQHA